MSSDPQAGTRSKLIMQRSMQAIQQTGLNVLKFASRVAENYITATPQFERCVDFYETGTTLASATAAEKANGKLVDRFLKSVVRFPADLEETWVDALPEPHRGDLVRELAARYGLLGAKAPALQAHEHVARLSDVLADAGRTAQLLAPMFANGSLKVEGESAQRIAHSLLVIDRSIGDLVALKEQIREQLPKQAASPPAKRRR